MVNNTAKNNIKIIIAAIIIFILSGCYDKTELEDRGFVMAIAIDKYEPELEKNNDEQNYKKDSKSENNKEPQEESYNMSGYEQKGDNQEDEPQTQDAVRINAQSKNPRFTVTITRANLGSIIGDSEEGNYITIVDNETIAGALNVAGLYSNQYMYYGYTEVVIISEAILKDKKLLRETIDTLERNKDISRETFIAVTKGQASKILTEEIKGDNLVGSFMSKIYRTNSSTSKSGVFHKELETLSKSLNVNQSAIIPRIEIEEGHVKLNGVAVIRDMQLVDWLSETDVRGYLWFLGKGEGLTISTKYQNVYIPLKISQNKAKLNFKEENGRIICQLNLNLEGTIEGYNLTSQGLYNEEILARLTEKYEKIIGEEIKTTFNIFYKDLLIDGFNFAETIRKKNNDIYLKYKNKEELLNNIDIDLDINVEIKSIGSIK